MIIEPTREIATPYPVTLVYNPTCEKGALAFAGGNLGNHVFNLYVR